ncbi:hypothetical protein AB1N83_006052 [Pleurotus pulmonarius]
MEPTRPPAGTRSKLNTLVLWDNVLEIKHVAGSQDLQYGVLIRSLFAVHDCCERIGTRDQTWWVYTCTEARNGSLVGTGLHVFRKRRVPERRREGASEEVLLRRISLRRCLLWT